MIAVARFFTSAVVAFRNARSAISTACWWCGIIWLANVASASLNAAAADVEGDVPGLSEPQAVTPNRATRRAAEAAVVR